MPFLSIILYMFSSLCTSLVLKGPTEGGIVVHEGTLTIRGQHIDPNWKHSSFEKALGKHNRTNSIVDVYDSTGIMLWNINEDEDPNETEITEFKVILSFDSSYTEKWFTTNTYTGHIIVEGYSISHQTSLNQLTAALPQYKFTNSGHTGWYDGKYKNIYIFVQFSNSLETLVYVAIGLDVGDNYD